MFEITAIEPQKKNPKRVNIFLDGQFAFGLSLEQKVEAKLKVDQTLTETQVKELIEKDQVSRLVEKALRFLSFRPRSEREIRNFLLKKSRFQILEAPSTVGAYCNTLLQAVNIFPDSVERVIDQLKKYNQINDLAFARWWIEQRQKFSPRGLRLIKMELAQKGVNREVIEQALEESMTKEGLETNEDSALKVAEKKLNSYKDLESKEFRAKLGQFLARRGYDWELISRVVKKIKHI